MANKRTLRTAIVGLRHGHAGTVGPERPGLVHTFRQLDGVEIVAYCEDSDSTRLDEAREHHPGARRYGSVDELIAHEQLDLACVALPASELPDVGIKLAEAGVHFYMDKQFARRAPDLARLVQAVHRNKIIVLPGYPHRFSPVAQDLKNIIDSGILGRPLDIEVRIVTGQVRPGGRDPTGFVYTDKDEGGGILHMLGGHYLEVMRFLMGCDVKSVQAMTGRPVGYIDQPLEDLAIAAFEYENGTYGSIHAGYLQRIGGGYDTSLVFRGLDGEANWTPIGDPRLDVTSTSSAWSGAPKRTYTYSFPPGPPGYSRPEWQFNRMQQFVYDVQEGREPALTVEDALRVLQTIDAVYESARTGQRVEVTYAA